MTSAGPFLLGILRVGKHLLIHWSLASPQLKPLLYLLFSLKHVFSDTVCFTSKQNLGSAPKLFWSLKKTILFFPWFFISPRWREWSKFLNPCTSHMHSMGPGGLETPRFLLHWFHLLASFVPSSLLLLSSCFFFLFMSTCGSSLSIFVFYPTVISQIRSSVLSFIKQHLWFAYSLEDTCLYADY